MLCHKLHVFTAMVASRLCSMASRSFCHVARSRLLTEARLVMSGRRLCHFDVAWKCAAVARGAADCRREAGIIMSAASRESMPRTEAGTQRPFQDSQDLAISSKGLKTAGKQMWTGVWGTITSLPFCRSQMLIRGDSYAMTSAQDSAVQCYVPGGLC